MSKFQCLKFMMRLVLGHAQRRGESNAAEMKTAHSVFVEMFVFLVGGRSARIYLCLTRATSFVETAVDREELKVYVYGYVIGP